MRLLVVPTAASGIHFEATVACMCSAEIGMVVAAAVLVPPGMHCSLAVGATNPVVVGVVATVAASDDGAAIVDVSVVAVDAGAVATGVATCFLSAVVISTPLVCPVQTCPSPSFLSLSIHVLLSFHPATFFAVRVCMHLRMCRPHHVLY